VIPLAQDLRHGLRALRRSPGYAAAAAVTLALGIGAITAVFTLLDAVLLRDLPVAAPERLVSLRQVYRGQENAYFSYPHLDHLRERATTLGGLAFMADVNRVQVAVAGAVDMARGELVSGEYFGVLGVRPHAGRLLLPADDRPDGAVAVISHGFWQRRFAADPAAVGRSMTVNGVPVTIVGVTPREFFGVTVGSAIDVRLPLRLRDRLQPGRAFWEEPSVTWLTTLGRLRAGVEPGQAAAELTPLFQQALARSPEPGQAEALDGRRLELLSARRGVAPGRSLRGYGPPLRMLMVVAGLVLLVACANVANLLLARAETRRREMAVRAALGATRGRLMRQLLAEGALLAALGGLLGLAVAAAGSAGLAGMLSTASHRVEVHTGPDLRTLAFTALASALSVLVFAMAPAFRASRVDLGAGAAAVVSGRSRWSEALLAGQVAMCVTLLFGAGLFVRSVRNALATEGGYQRADVFMFSADPSLMGYPPGRTAAFYAEALASLRSVPGVIAASAAQARPIDGELYLVGGLGFIDGRRLGREERIRHALNAVAPGYFSTLQIPVLAGREFRAEDHGEAPRVAIVSEALARQAFPGQNPIGRRLGSTEREALEVVGVVGDTRYGRLTDAPRGILYLPLYQAPSSSSRQVSFLVRYSGGLAAITAAAMAGVAAVDRSLPLYRVNTLEAEAEDSLLRERLLARTSTLFGVVAMLLAGVGLYGSASFNVARRGREIGLRMALGADRSRVVRMTLRQSLAPVAVGALVGLPAAYLTMRIARSLLFRIAPHDPSTMCGAVALLMATAAAAGYLPARRAARVEPMVALRAE
jgi:predicted permease